MRTGPAEGEKETLELGEIVALIRADITDVDIAGVRRNRIDVRGLVAVVASRHRAVEALPRHTGKGSEPLILFAERAGGERRHRRGIEPAAEQAAERMRAAHLPAHGDIERVTQSLGVSLIGR